MLFARITRTAFSTVRRACAEQNTALRYSTVRRVCALNRTQGTVLCYTTVHIARPCTSTGLDGGLAGRAGDGARGAAAGARGPRCSAGVHARVRRASAWRRGTRGDTAAGVLLAPSSRAMVGAGHAGGGTARPVALVRRRHTGAPAVHGSEAALSYRGR